MNLYSIIEETRVADAELVEELKKQALKVHPKDSEELLRAYLVGALLLDIQGKSGNAKKVSIANITIEKSENGGGNKYWQAYSRIKALMGYSAGAASVSII